MPQIPQYEKKGSVRLPRASMIVDKTPSGIIGQGLLDAGGVLAEAAKKIHEARKVRLLSDAKTVANAYTVRPTCSATDKWHSPADTHGTSR